MIQLKKYALLPEAGTIALIVDKKSKLPAAIPEEIKEVIRGFYKSEENVDFFRTTMGNYFLYK